MIAVIARNAKCELAQLPIPTLAANQVLIKVHSTALNRADTLQRRGVYPPPAGVTEVLGLELAGTVVEGKGGFVEGQRVMALVSGGAFAEYCVADCGSVMRVPDDLPLDVAASLPEAWLTAFQLLSLVGRVRSDDVVMVHAGASGVGTAAIQLARHVFGCQHVIATSSPGKHAVCRDAGATLCLDRDAAQWDLQGAPPVSLLLDCVGGGAYADKNLACLGMDARWVLFGLMNSKFDQTPTDKVMRMVLGKRITLVGSTLRARTDQYKQELVREFVRAGCVDKLAANKGLQGQELKPVLDKRSFAGLASINEALDYMETNQSTGKIVVRL